MKKKFSATLTMIALFGVCVLAQACSHGQRETAGTVLAIHPRPVSIKHELSTSATQQDPSAGTYSFDLPELGSDVNRATYSPGILPPQTIAHSEMTYAVPTSPVTRPTTVTADKPEKTVDVSVPVLNYHSVGVKEGSTLILEPAKFAKQMGYLAEQGYTPLSLSDFTLILEKRKTAPAKPVLLTFDDGYVDNYEQAMPVLKQYGFPATVFISPGSIGDQGKLDWQQVKKMHEAGWDIQPHGMTHPHLPQLSQQKQTEEITQARAQIAEHLGTKPDVFCYPYGEFNKQTLDILKEEGFRLAFTIEQGKTTSSQEPFKLKRIYVNAQDSLSAWSKKLSW